MVELTKEELALCDEISQLGSDVYKLSRQTEGLTTDPKMFSIMLFRRLWSNHRGFLVLWRGHHIDEAGMVLRSGLEAAICIAANAKLGAAFQDLVRKDGAYTLQRQIKRFNEVGEDQGAAEAEAALHGLLSGLPDGTKPSPLNWKELAHACDIPQLYSSHRMLSGISSHVTGLSLLQDVVSDTESERLQAMYTALTRKMYLMMMVGATLHGCALHAEMLESADLLAASNKLIERMNAVSMDWK